MDEISTITCPSLLEKNVEDLHAEGIVKLLHFFMYSRDVIMRIARLDSSGYEVMKNEILNVSRPAPITVNQLCKRSMFGIGNRDNMFISTGFIKLNVALNGGFKGGEIVEVFGPSGSGKTQFCLSMALDCCGNENSVVAYIDSKNDISGSAFKSRSGLNKELLQRLRIFKRFDFEETVGTLNDFNVEMCLGQMNMCNQLRIVIIDSLPIIMYPSVSDPLASWTFHVDKFMEQVKCLARQGVLVIIVSNAVAMYTKWSKSGNNKPGGIKPALGKYWAHQPNFRLLLCPAKYNDSKIEISIVKSTRKVKDEPILIGKSDIFK